MSSPQDSLDSAITEIERLKNKLKKGKSKQVSISDERVLIKVTAQTWFKNHRQHLLIIDEKKLLSVDSEYKVLLIASDRLPARNRLIERTKNTKKQLIELRSAYATALLNPSTQHTSDQPPRFDSLIGDLQMQSILTKRWNECTNCLSSNAPLAATVMMGGLLEGLLLAKVNQTVNKGPVFTAKAAPKDKSGQPLKLKDWGLKDFIEVAHELTWISQPTMVISNVLRDYRNYIHPHKEHALGISISPSDARMFWEITKNIARQLLNP